jgi:hypothetical protein
MDGVLIPLSGGVSTIQVPYTVTIAITQSQPTKTLFAPCQQRPPAITTSIWSVVTPPPVIVTEQTSSTAADGSVFVNTVVVTSTVAPTSVLTAPTPVQQNAGGTTGKQVGPIVGGAVGGFIGLIGIVWLIWFMLYVSFASFCFYPLLILFLCKQKTA